MIQYNLNTFTIGFLIIEIFEGIFMDVQGEESA